jgi:hypothetical protein
MTLTTQEKTGSVGASWPPRYDHHNRRVKGFCLSPLEGVSESRRMLETVRQASSENPHATRTTIRAFVRKGLTESVMREGPNYPTEARFDVSNALPGFEMVYFGRNSVCRISSGSVLSRELGSVWDISRMPRAEPGHAAERVARAGYSVSRLNGDGRQEIGRLVQLYQEAYQEYTFDITPQTVGGMLENGNIVIVARDSASQVVSALIAEHVQLQLERGPLVHLFELSDYATFRAHRGRGLMTLLQMEAINAIRALPYGREAVIYAEDRAAWKAVNQSSQRAGLTYSGTLNQHCVLVSDRDFGEEGRFENLNVWAHTTG